MDQVKAKCHHWKKKHVLVQISICALLSQQATVLVFRNAPMFDMGFASSASANTLEEVPLSSLSPHNRGSTTTRQLSAASCIQERGKSGKWVQDWDYAERTNYPVRGSYSNWHVAAQKFQPTPEQPFRLATSWTWQDDACPVQETSLEGFCAASKSLGVSRYLIVGDSMSTEFTMSLLSLLDAENLLPKWRTTHRGLNKPFKIKCPPSSSNSTGNSSNDGQHTITVWFYKRSPLRDVLDLEQQAANNRAASNKNSYRSFVQDNPERTAIVANTGAWIGSLDEYRQAFDAMVHWIDSFDPNKIIAFYRPSIPGHLNCLPQQDGQHDIVDAGATAIDDGSSSKRPEHFDWGQVIEEVPYKDYKDYKTNTNKIIRATQEKGMSVNTHNWFIMEEYNAYSQSVLQERSLCNSSSSAAGIAPIHCLNIFPSAILRRDGHIGFSRDCLHYYLPGPTDWWVHFFYSALMDLSTERAMDEIASSISTTV